MQVQDAKIMCEQLMQKHCPEKVAMGWKTVIINTNRLMGQCRYGPKEVALSKKYIEINGVESIRDTILHEIAHVITPGDGHGSKWKAVCRKIGASPLRLDSKSNAPDPKWVLHVKGEAKILRKFYRKSSKSYKNSYQTGRPETKGLLVQTRYSDFKKMFKVG